MGVGTEPARDQLVENLQLDLHDQLMAAFVASAAPTTNFRAQLRRSVLGAANRSNDDMLDLAASIESLRGPIAITN